MEHKNNIYIDAYNELPELLRFQLKRLSYILNPGNPDDIIFRLNLLETLTAPELIKLFSNNISNRHGTFNMKDLICYNNLGNWIYLSGIIARGKHVFVLSGSTQNDTPIAIKWYKSGSETVEHETRIYQKLERMGCTIPNYDAGFKFWQDPVLVLEKLSRLNKKDNPREVGISVLKQLFHVHKFGVHNDIKPENIMKRVQDNGPKYFLIDYGGVTQKKYKWGFKRRIWSSKWTCQKFRENNQVTSPWHDFVELGYTMKAIENMKTGEKSIKEGFTGNIDKYMNYVNSIDKKYVSKRDYRAMIDILKE